MAEPLTRELMLDQIAVLLAAFPRATGRTDTRLMAETYRTGLTGLSGDALRFAVSKAIQEDTYFPKVARLRELATSWTKRTYTTAVQQMTAWNRCAICGAEAKPKNVERRKRHSKTFALLEPVEWETVSSQMLYMEHNRRAHFVGDIEIYD